jgi:glycopeptide antibiotics resistance protein
MAPNYIQLIPFKTIIQTISNNPIQVFGNILLLLPLGFMLKKFTKLSFIRCVIICALCSLGIEVLQYIVDISLAFPNHIVDIDDIILNVVGGIVGIGCSYLFTFLNLDKYINKIFLKQPVIDSKNV